MTTQNDEQIRNLLAVIEKKKSEVGEKPNGVRLSNGLLKQDDSGTLNINTIGNLELCVSSVAILLKRRGYLKEAADFLEVDFKDSETDNLLNDLKLRASIIKWELEKKKLDALEKQLKDLRSEHARTADAVSDIMKQLSL